MNEGKQAAIPLEGKDLEGLDTLSAMFESWEATPRLVATIRQLQQQLAEATQRAERAEVRLNAVWPMVFGDIGQDRIKQAWCVKGNVVVFDYSGTMMVELQGKYDVVAKQVIAHADSGTLFTGEWEGTFYDDEPLVKQPTPTDEGYDADEQEGD